MKKVYKKNWFWLIIVIIGLLFSPLLFMSWDTMLMELSKMGKVFTLQTLYDSLILVGVIMTFFGIIYFIATLVDKKHRKFRNNVKVGDVVTYSPTMHRKLSGAKIKSIDKNMVTVEIRVPKNEIKEEK